MNKIKDPIYFENGLNFKINKNESDSIEDLIGTINSVLNNKGMQICYCTDEDKNKTLFSAWEIRPYPEN